MDHERLLQEIRSRLHDVYGDRLCGVVLYGSEVRGSAEPDSDIDVLVLLKGPVALWRDIRTITAALYPVQLEVIRPLDAMPVDVRDYEAGRAPVYRRAKREGIRV